MPSASRGDERSPDPVTYYWAGGEKITLSPSGQVAIDLRRAGRASVPSKRLAAIRRDGRPVNDALVVVDAAALDPAERDALDATSALQPVYGAADGTLIIVLPEVRVETEQRSPVDRVLERYGDELGVHVDESRPGRFSLTLDRGNGSDALRVANDLVEHDHPSLAQARFVRIVPRRSR